MIISPDFPVVHHINCLLLYLVLINGTLLKAINKSSETNVVS